MPETAGKANAALDPQQLLQMSMSFTTARILSAAVRLDVFSPLASGPKTVAAVAKAAGASERGTRMLLDALTALQLLTKSGGNYGLTPAAAQYLVRGSRDYMGAFIADDSLRETWDKLDEAIRTGRPPRRVEDQAAAEKFFPLLIASLHVLNRAPAALTAQALGAGAEGRRNLRILDVACGSGVWGIAEAEADPGARLTLQDFPGVLEHTKQYVKRHGLDKRCDYLPGDLKRVDFGEGRYDVALLGNIVHSEGEASSRDLFRRLHRALRPEGQLAVIDILPNEERTGPPWAVVFALNMLVNTSDGDTYTLDEYRRWLLEAGFARVETAEIASHSPLVVAVK
jgi:2-polyprenyl-3-methyl-5-hydroxy-6-metoxy-1,4-benzoquinol methylase